MNALILINTLLGCLVILGLLGMASLLRWQSTQLAAMEQRINVKLSELSAKLTAVADQVDKVKTEVQNLKDSLTNVELPADAQAALDRLTESVNAVDAINPDVVIEPPPT